MWMVTECKPFMTLVYAETGCNWNVALWVCQILMDQGVAWRYHELLLARQRSPCLWLMIAFPVFKIRQFNKFKQPTSVPIHIVCAHLPSHIFNVVRVTENRRVHHSLFPVGYLWNSSCFSYFWTGLKCNKTITNNELLWIWPKWAIF